MNSWHGGFINLVPLSTAANKAPIDLRASQHEIDVDEFLASFGNPTASICRYQSPVEKAT